MNKRLSISKKKRILDCLSQPKATQCSVAKLFGISRRTVQYVLANKELINKVIVAGVSGARCHLKVDQKFEDVNEATYKWFTEMREKHGEIPISESIICGKAIKFANMLKITGFKASKGWLRCWKERNSLKVYAVSNLCFYTSVQVCGERRDVPLGDVEQFLQNLPLILSEYDSKNVFNADETALYYKCLPGRTLEFSHNSASGGKVCKERLTLLLGCSMSGEKLPPLVIGKHKSPRCFRGIDCKHLPCEYKHSRNAWMTTTIFQEWLSDLDRRMVSQRRHIILFLDNATPHRNIQQLSNIRLQFLPPNCTSIIQPMDQGVIWSFKCKFRKLLLEHVISEVDVNFDLTVAKKLHVLHALHFTKRAWSDVHPDVLINGFSKAGFQEKPLLDTAAESNCDGIDDFFSYVKMDEQLFQEEIKEIEVDTDEVNVY